MDREKGTVEALYRERRLKTGSEWLQYSPAGAVTAI